MYIGEIKSADCANGTGMRVSVFVSGCRNHCKGCFQPETWSFTFGEKFDEKMEEKILSELSKPHYQGITFLGGDPMEQENQPEVLRLIKKIKKEMPKKTVWIYTGYVYEKDLKEGGKKYIPSITDEILDNTDILVDGPFIEEKKRITLNFRGSSNQRIIDMKKTRKGGEVVLSPLNN